MFRELGKQKEIKQTKIWVWDIERTSTEYLFVSESKDGALKN